ncbi:TonB-dependent receptor [Flectobacillus major]|uniref:TonB-dependent receptor n=1 Tax=Flectobacillus major TaxID=103 RepID=UPI00040905E5|nr:TonB-dependent receptor [Flectobacillus major]
MGKKTTILYLLLSLFGLNQGFSQQKVVTGKVTSQEDNSPLIGVSVVIKGTNTGTTTTPNGTFRLNYLKGSTLVFSFIGYQTKEVPITSGSEINISLSPSINTLGEVQVVGSRNANRTKLDSPVPVDVVNIKQLQESAPQVTITQILQYVAPSFHSAESSGGDAASATNLAQLRGLSVDQVLVLVNGKRRHKSSNINFGGNGNGSTGYDLNALPTASIERIEVLRDGAAAQYGSDAIAGVINIVLKKNTDNLLVSTTGGVRYSGDGEFTRSSINYGFKTGENGGFVNLTAEFGTQGIAEPVGGGDNGLYTGPIYGGGAGVRDYDAIFTKEIDEAILAKRGLTRKYFNQRSGPNRQKDALTFFNAALPLSNGAEFYAFGGLSYRNSEFTAVRRLPGWGTRNNTFIYPDGFLPAIELGILDKSLAVGIRGKVRGWSVDFSNVYGGNSFTNRVTHSLNASLGLKTPKNFFAGAYGASQNTTSLDFSQYFDKVLHGLNIAFGAQYRVETYYVEKGEPNSYIKADTRTIYDIDTTYQGIPYLQEAGQTALNGTAAGSQIYPGFRPESETNVSRSIVSAYLDLETNITPSWTLSGALRVENFSDFGNVLTGKAATRYQFAPWLAIRGSVSSGFRAPDLAQFYYTAVSTSFLGGVGVDILTASNVSAAARALGIPSLTPEKSRGYTLGFTSKASRNIELSIDAYSIDIDDRIVQTGNFSSSAANLPADLKAAFAATGANQANFFYNAISSRTRGIDITSSYKAQIGNGNFTFIAAANFGKNEIRKINTPKGLEAFVDVIVSPTEKVRVESSIPQRKISLQGLYAIDRWNFLLRTVHFGDVNVATNFGGGNIFYQNFSPKWITDVSAGYKISPTIQVTAGINNVFNVLADYTDQLVAGRRIATPGGGQFVSTGGRAFVRLAATF